MIGCVAITLPVLALIVALIGLLGSPDPVSVMAGPLTSLNLLPVRIVDPALSLTAIEPPCEKPRLLIVTSAVAAPSPTVMGAWMSGAADSGSLVMVMSLVITTESVYVPSPTAIVAPDGAMLSSAYWIVRQAEW